MVSSSSALDHTVMNVDQHPSKCLWSMLWKKPFLMAMLLVGIITLVAGALTATFHAAIPQEGDVPVSAPAAAVGIQQAIVVFISMVALLIQAVHNSRRARNQDEEEHQCTRNNNQKNQTTVDTPGLHRLGRKLRRYSMYDVVVAVLLFLNLFSIVIAVVQICSTTTSFGDGDKTQVRIATGDIVSVCLHAVFCICACLTVWWPLIRVAKRCLFVIGLVQVTIGIILEELNFREVLGPPTKNGYHYRASKNMRRSSYSRLSYSLYVGSIEVAIGLLTVALCWVTNSSNRLSVLIRRFVVFFVVCSLFSLIFVIISCVLSLVLIYNTNSTISDTTAYANVAISWIAFFLHIAAMVATNYLQARPNSHLEVEEFDLNALNPAQIQAFATLIDNFGKTAPGAPSGLNAMSMMQAYSAVNIAGLHCKVLRVYKPIKNEDHEINNANRGNKSPANKLLDYYTQKEFRNLDKPNTILSDKEIELNSLSHMSSATLTTSTDNLNKGLSKNKLKKLMKKQGAAGKNATKRGSIPFPLENPLSPEELAKEVEFNEKLMMTEALVLLSVVEEYDLTTSHESKFYRLLNVTLGGGSRVKWFRPLCVRLGLLAFHWPFRQSTFFCSPTKRPAARSAAVMRGIAEWNSKLPYRQKCKILLDPLYYNDVSERAIEPAGWSRVPLPPTHIVDLRPYKGKTITDYLKGVKYRSQSGAFQRANGEVVETADFTPENCAEVMRLWRNIAEKRTTDGNTSVLVDPTVDLFRTLGDKKTNGDSYRTLLFLRVNGVNIASCVLFRLGETITSDLQGLDHETARQYKAYFVMMQETIQIALKEKISFVDFGPTTAKPKIDIGCKSVPQVGSIYSVSTLINWSMGMFAKNVELNN